MKITRRGKKRCFPADWQRRMDEIPVDFCERLYIANGFVTEIAAGHVVSIRRETA